MRYRYSPRFRRVFNACLPRVYGKGLHQILAHGDLDGAPTEVPLLFVANHVSRWDGFALWDLQRSLRPHGRVRTLMLESGMREHWIFRWLGGIPLRPGDPVSIRRAFRLAKQERLQHQENFSALFLPQGKIWPSTRRPLGFQRGIELLARELAPIAVLPVGIHLEPLHHPKPTLFLSVGHAVPAGEARAERLEALVEERLDLLLSDLGKFGETIGENLYPVRRLFPSATT